LLIDDYLLFSIAPFSGLTIYNIYSPDSMRYLSNFMSSVQNVYVRNDYAYLAASGRITVVDISRPVVPESVAYFPVEGSVFALGGIGDYLYATSVNPDGFHVIDIGNPTVPELVGSCELDGFMYSMALSDGYAFAVGADSIFSVIDVSNPANPTVIASEPMPERGWDIEVADHFAFVACYEVGVCLFDIANPFQPVLITTYDTPGNASHIALSLPYIYVGDQSSLQILRFNPTAADEPTPLPGEIALSQNYPNPFNAGTTIEYTLARRSDVRIDIFDIQGRRVAMLVDGQKPAGKYRVVWEAGELPSGVYIYRLSADRDSRVHRCLLLK
jgi:hypothetical protein